MNKKYEAAVIPVMNSTQVISLQLSVMYSGVRNRLICSPLLVLNNVEHF